MSLKTSLSFLATDISQMPPPAKYGNKAIEAVSFNRADLEDGNWELVWKNVEIACKNYLPKNVTYHFPMNDSDYVEDEWVYSKLIEAYRRVNDLDLSGMVIHSNRIKTFSEWSLLNVRDEQKKVLDRLKSLVKTTKKAPSSWLGLENMPLVGNSGYDIDPLFCFVSDFENLPDGVGIVWDICHAVSTVEYLHAHEEKRLKEDLTLRTSNDDYLDFVTLQRKIQHYHFAGVKGLNDPESNKVCVEGVLPTESSIPEGVYIKAVKLMDKMSPGASINFEVQERNYYERDTAPIILNWVKGCL